MAVVLYTVLRDPESLHPLIPQSKGVALILTVGMGLHPAHSHFPVEGWRREEGRVPLKALWRTSAQHLHAAAYHLELGYSI